MFWMKKFRRNWKNVDSTFLSCMDFIFTNVWVHPPAEKFRDSSGLALLLYLKHNTDFDLLSWSIYIMKGLPAKATVN